MYRPQGNEDTNFCQHASNNIKLCVQRSNDSLFGCSSSWSTIHNLLHKGNETDWKLYNDIFIVQR